MVVRLNLLFLLYFFVIPSASQATYNLKECQENTGSDRKIYRDETGKVRCVNFGNNKSVEYDYSSEFIEIKNTWYEPGSVIKKTFSGFTTLENRSYTPDEDSFYLGVLKEFFGEINKLQSLDQWINQRYPKAKQQNNFIDDIVNDYFNSQKEEVPEQLKELPNVEKLKFIQNQFEKEPPTAAESEPITPLNFLDKERIRSNLNRKNGEKPSVKVCNSRVVADLTSIIEQKAVKRREMKDPRMLAETSAIDGKITVLLSNLLLNTLYDKNYGETKIYFQNIPYQIQLATINQRYHGGEDPFSNGQMNDLSVLTRALVHELGHVHQFVLMKNPNDYSLTRILPGLAVRISKKDQFLSIPAKDKKAVQEEVVEPLMKVMEFSAESFFVDNIPCVL